MKFSWQQAARERVDRLFERLMGGWPEYAMEALGLGLFMVSACMFTALLEHPASPVRQALPDAAARRILMGLAMGSTAILLIYSPWGQHSGAHLNPAVTLAFARLGKIQARDAAAYIAAQFVGGWLGVRLAAWLLGATLEDPAVRFAATVPGMSGRGVAFLAELTISFLLMTVMLWASNTPQTTRWTGCFAGGLVASFIAMEAPLSGMSMNPARTLGSALSAGEWTGLWIYFLAPPAGMLAAAEWYRRGPGLARVFCAKLSHPMAGRCLFRCRYPELSGRGSSRD